MTNPTLTVYKASAGSGKTFTLAKEYIKLLINNPEAFRGILAVTFTNKATEEMKMRILSQLYGLWKQLPDSDGYMRSLVKETDASPDYIAERAGPDYIAERAGPDYIAERAGRALHLLLHNYHYFRVQTIDTFFQSVLRNLAHELQLNANLRVALNQEQVVEQAVDNLIDSIADDAAMRKVVMGYVRERLSNNESWNFIKSIKEFGENIFKDFYKEHRERLFGVTSSPDFFVSYKKKLYTEKKRLEQKYDEIGQQGMQYMSDNALTLDDFSYGRNGAMSYFIKLSTGRFYEIDASGKRMTQFLSTPAAWAAKKSDHYDAVVEVAESSLLPLMQHTEKHRAMDSRTYISINKTLEHINDVQLLIYIEEFAKQLNNAAQRFMLSDTPTLLNAMIKGDDSPFIYEKIGAHLEHIMIDEFQDTSTAQWCNFKKLLEECMSRGQSNLLVGDVKQSIYRWRSGDWRLLNNINMQFDAATLRSLPLKTNYRSMRNIVNFNNHFFRRLVAEEVSETSALSPAMAGELQKAYEDVEQLIPDNKPQTGLVNIELINRDEESTMNQRVLEIITTLADKGARLQDIAILLRGNKEAVLLATYLEREGISVVSAEAFKLNASPAVRTIIGAMKYLARPNDLLTLRLLLKDSRRSTLPEQFEERRDQLITLSLHDMAEEILRLFELGNEEGAYLSSFFDHLRAFSNDTSTVLQDFLQAWDDDISAKAIETPECDGVRILTIHKSKGLEFKHVIIPYCNWRLEQRSTLWCEPMEAPYNELPIVPLNYTSPKAFENSIYKDAVTEEHIQNTVDNLNLLYVAFTRACHSLFVIGVRADNESKKTPAYRSQKIEDTIRTMQQTMDNIEGVPLHICIPDDAQEPITLTYGGTEELFNEKEQAPSRNVFMRQVQPVKINIASFENQAEFRQSNKSRTFADDAIDETDRERYIRMGTVMHQLFSEIKTIADVEPTLRRMEFDGTLYGNDISHEELISEIERKFENPQVKEWFAEGWTLYNECTIISREGEYRPDRVMTDGQRTVVVDFKFGRPHKDYHQQVMRYTKLLEDMGMPAVKGYLWYVTLNHIEQV